LRTSQTLMLEMSEKRGELATVTETLNASAAAGSEPAAEDVGKADGLTREIRALEVRYRAAVLKEEEEDRAAEAGDPNAPNAKLAELRAKCSVTAFMHEAVSGNETAGPEAEYRAEVLGDASAAGFVPIEFFAGREDRAETRDTEQRAVTPVADSATGLGSQADILPRIFTRSVAAGLGVGMPSVPMGVRTWPIMTGGTTASMQAPSGKQEAVAGQFKGETLGPVRLTGSYEFRVEDLQLLRGLEDALRRDLRMVLSDKMDDQVINGDGNAPNVPGMIGANGIPAGPNAAAAAAGYEVFVQAFTGGVNGLYSFGLGDIRSVWGAETYQHAETLYRANNTDDTVYAVMQRRSGGIRVTNRIAAGKVQDAIFARAAFPGTTAVAPVWSAVQMIRDPYSLAQQGEVRITMLMLWNFKVIRPDAFYRRSIRNAA